MASHRPTATIFFILMAVLIDMIAVGVIMPVLLTSFSMMAGCLLLTGLARSLPVIVALRFLSGFSQSNVAIAQAAVADVTEPALRGQRFGLIGSMVGLGYVLGPVLGGLLVAVSGFPADDWRLGAPFYASSLLLLAAAVVAAFTFRIR